MNTAYQIFQKELKDALEKLVCPIHNNHPEVKLLEDDVHFSSCCDKLTTIVNNKYKQLLYDYPESLYAFEYQEESGNFHNNMYGNTNIQNTAGYKTLFFGTMDEWEPFYKIITGKYDFQKTNRHTPPLFDTLKHELVMFLKSKTSDQK